MNRRFLPSVMAITFFLASGCSKPATETARSSQGTSVLIAQGSAIFETRCFVCHGRGGKGDGPASQGASAHPQDLTSSMWQKSTSDPQIATVIRNGGGSVGKSPAMPANPDLTDDQIEALSRFIRSLGGQSTSG
jgi:mono/diheme cytochrome c family protein